MIKFLLKNRKNIKEFIVIKIYYITEENYFLFTYFKILESDQVIRIKHLKVRQFII